jgi:Protein kinase domain
MSILLSLSTLALRGIVDGAWACVGIEQGGAAVVGFLTERFTDHSQRLTRALHSSSEKAWKALEIALAGDSLWDRCKASIARSEDKAFAQQVRAFLDAAPLLELSGKTAIRQKCLAELRAARKAGALTKGSLDHRQLAKQAGDFTRFGDPTDLVDAEWLMIVGIATEMKEAGYASLAWLLSQRSAQEMPVLVIAVRYFFRRAVEDDPKLFQGLAFAKLEALGKVQEAGFAALSGAFTKQGQRLEELLSDVKAIVVQTHSAVLDLQEQVKGLSAETRQMFQAVMQQLEQRQLERRELRPSDSLSIRGDAERQLVKRLVSRYRALPEEQRQKTPALLNAIGKLEVVAGDFEAAQEDFQQVATLVSDSAAKAEAHFNAYHAALERRDNATALAELLAAVKLETRRFAPFPVSKYQPQRILGAGGFGVAFLCRHKELKADVVVKTLANDDLGRDVDEVLNEARVLYQLDHPSIVRLLDCGYTIPAEKARPYFVMNYFKGVTLEEYVQKRGPLSPQDLMAVARQIAKGLQAAHDKGILHRDVKPANILVLKDDNSWKVKIIDFGLALKEERIASAASTNRQSKTIMGSSIAGTLDYAAPEQMGRQSEPIGPYSDVYGFAKTCSFALFQTTQPLFKHWQSLPLPLAQLLEKCLEEDPKKRPQSFAAVLKTLSSSKGNHPEPSEGTKSSASATAYAIAVTALVAAGYLATIIGGFTYFMVRNSEMLGVFMFFLAFLFWLSASITSLVGIYRMWRVVARAKEDPTPKAAVGLLCVPFFNFYWIFRAIPGLSAALERDLHKRDPSGDHWTGWIIGLIACILFCIPYLNLVSPIVFVIWLNLASSATNRLIRLREGRGHRSSAQET